MKLTITKYIESLSTVRRIIICLLAIAILGGCDIRDNEIEPQAIFTKIYNNDNFDDSFHALSVVQTPDQGYLILAGKELTDSDFLGVYLIKTDDQGSFVWESSPHENYANAVSGWITEGNSYRFFCMDKLNLGAYLIEVNPTSGATTEINYIDDILYPLSAASISNGYVVQGYNREDMTTVFGRLNQNGTVVWREEYETFEDVEEHIIRHMIRTSRPLPFFSGEVGNTLYFNGFYNFSFSMVFLNGNDGAITGVINGPGVDDAISSALNIGNNEFALSRYNNLENKIVPRHPVDVNAIGVTGDLEGYDYQELTQKARVKIRVFNTQGKNLVLYGTETKSGRLLLLAYDRNSQELLGSHYLGFEHPYQIGDFISTEDGGLAVLGTTHIQGRFARVSLFKLSSTQLDLLVGNK